MALKIIIFLSSIWFTTFSYSSIEDNYAFKLYRLGKHQQALMYLNKKYRKNQQTEKIVLLYTLIYQALKKNNEAYQSAIQVINRFYKTKHTQLFNNWKKGDLEDDSVSKSLLLAYYIAAQAIINMDSHTTSSLDMVNFYLEICLYNEFKLDAVERLQSRLSQIKEERIKALYYWTFSFSLQYITWQDPIVLTENSSGSTSKIFATNSGQCLGVQLTYQNGYYGYSMDSCLIQATAYLKSESSSTLNYSHKQNGLQALYFSGGIFLKPFSERNRIGLNSFALHSQDYSLPSGYTGAQKTLNFGFSINSALYINQSIYIATNFVTLTSSNLFSLGLGYEF